MEEIEFHHSLPIQLRFNDVDKFGHVNNTVYFSFYDLGKTEYFASVCPGVDWEKDGIVVVHIEADFLAQIFSSDQVGYLYCPNDFFCRTYFRLCFPLGRKCCCISDFFDVSIFSRYPDCRLTSIGRAVYSVEGKFMGA